MTASNGPSASSGPRNLVLLEDSFKSPHYLKSPKASSSLFLGKPLGGNASSASVNELQPPNTPGAGIRAQLGHLLPRHAQFRARVHIHQISNVPLISGEFGVRWKFKGVQAPPGPKQGLLERVKARTERRIDKGKGREDDGEDGLLGLLSPGAPTNDGHVSTQLVDVGRVASSQSISQTLSMNPSTSLCTSSSSSRISETIQSQTLSVGWSASSTSTSTLSSNVSHSTIHPTPATHSPPESPDFLNSLLSPTGNSTPSRGATAFLKLKDHSVTWNQTLETILKFDIDRENGLIQPNPLKLVVMQRVIADDPEGPPQNPRLGAVYLNLAEYIDKGSVERRYLLKESRTNATLKLTIEMEYVSGETTYTAPALAKGEIMNGIANFLENEGVKRPRALDLYGPYQDQEELEIDLLGRTKPTRIKPEKPARRPYDSTHPTESEVDEIEDEDQSLENVGVAFDVHRLPMAYGTKTTETLIEAIFNPVKITEKRQESPFTYYKPPQEPLSGATIKPKPFTIGLGLSGVAVDNRATIARRQGSLTTDESTSFYDTTSSSSASVRTTASSSYRSYSRESGTRSETHHGVTSKSTPEGRVVVTAVEQPVLGGVRGWWKRHTSSRNDTITQKT